MAGSAAAQRMQESRVSSFTAAQPIVRARLRVMSMAERVARKACLFAPLASRYIAKKIEAIEPKRVPTAPEKKLASGRSTAGGNRGGAPAGPGGHPKGKNRRTAEEGARGAR